MNRKLCLLLLGILALGISAFAQDMDLGSASDDEFNQALDSSAFIDVSPEDYTPESVEETAVETDADAEEALVAEEIAPDTEGEEAEEPVIPYRVRNNKFFLESQRFARLAEGTYNLGDYDASTEYANEAIRNAELSDEYVALQMKIREANSAIAAAKYRIDWAVSSGASKQFPVEFREAETWYNESLSARIAEEWDTAIDAAHRVVELLAYIDAPAGTVPLPAQYTVRSWTTFRDCLWNIAGRPWVYGNPRQWRVLYNANRSKFPDPDNPNLIEPGMVLDIPSIRGEFRQGSWDGNRTYPPIN
jgi:nucleoid-associated protein YgaU